jgi:hypothetical protein
VPNAQVQLQTDTKSKKASQPSRGDFSFHADLLQSMVGGNDIKVWYHPDCLFRPSGLVPVLDIYWQAGIENYKLHTFDRDPRWQQEILKVMDKGFQEKTPQMHLADF